MSGDTRVMETREVVETDAEVEPETVSEVEETTPETVAEIEVVEVEVVEVEVAPETIDDVEPVDASAETTETIDDVTADTDTSGGCALGASVHDELYTGLAGLDDVSLRAELYVLVTDGAQGFGYDAARNLMYGVTGNVDVNPDNEVECVYTGVMVMADGTRSPGSGDFEITTEHSWPRSDGAETFPAEGDIHHLYPVLSQANNTRAVYEFGDTACGHDDEAACAWSQGDSHLGRGVDGRPIVFEVRPDRRGDIARAHFYFAVRYELSIPTAEEATLRRWHCDDPPSDDERQRNDRVAAFQKNRNPFIDQPYMVERISNY